MKTMVFASVLIVSVAWMAGCSTAPKSGEDMAALDNKVQTSVSKAKEKDPSLKTLFDSAAGYAVFPQVAKGAIGVGGAYGKGEVYEKDALAGYCTLTQASLGLALGGQAYTEIIFFETPEALTHFKSGNFAFSAQATAVALKSGVGANAKYENGVMVVTMGEAGLMYEASVGGQKFSYQAKMM